MHAEGYSVLAQDHCISLTPLHSPVGSEWLPPAWLKAFIAAQAVKSRPFLASPLDGSILTATANGAAGEADDVEQLLAEDAAIRKEDNITSSSSSSSSDGSDSSSDEDEADAPEAREEAFAKLDILLSGGNSGGGSSGGNALSDRLKRHAMMVRHFLPL